MHQLITKIGKGQRGAKDLSWGEAKQAAQDLIEGNATPYQAGAFLMAMRIKLEGVTELASFTAATRSYVSPITAPAGLNVVDVPVYAEKHNTNHVCLPAAIVAASAGATILFHGMDNPTASSDLPRVLEQLGIPATLQGQDLLASLQRNGFAYLDLALYHPPWQNYWRCANNWEPKTCSIRSPGCSIPRERTRKWWAWPIRRISKRSRKR